MKTNAIIRIIIWSLVLILLLSMFGTGLLFRSKHSNSDPDFVHTSDRIYLNPDDVRQLDIDWVAGSIVIEQADVDSIRISEAVSGETPHTMAWNLNNRKLSIQSGEDITIGFGINLSDKLSKDLTILVPMGWECDSLEIDAASASVEITNMTIRKVDLEGASGICTFESCTVRELDMDTASGDVYFTGSLDVMDCDAASASVYAAFYNVPSCIDMDSMSGNLDISLPSYAGFTVDMDALSSDFFSEFGYAQKRDGSYSHGDGKCRITLDAMSGDLYIREHKTAEEAP